MVELVIRNHNPDAALQKVRFNLKTGHFLTPSKQILQREDLSDSGFVHPILAEKPLLEVANNHYTYIYHNAEECCLALRFVYATVLQAKNPALCSIRIQPAKDYSKDTQTYTLYFSSHPRKKAKQLLTTPVLNAMVSELGGYPFQYCNHNLIDTTLTWVDLVNRLDADQLYQKAPIDPRELTHQLCLDQYELRFINARIGFGLFARSAIKQGDLVAEYCGKYDSKKLEYRAYCYVPEKKLGYNLLLDAKHLGNVARFVNHAPKANSADVSGPYLTANLDVVKRSVYGTIRIMQIANRDIEPGEQLLSSYGSQYFSNSIKSYHIQPNGRIFDASQRRIKDSAAQLKRPLSVFARFGNRRAQWLLFRKPLITICLCIGFGVWAH